MNDDFFQFIKQKEALSLQEAKVAFGARLKRLRKSKSMTAVRMSKEFDISRPAIARLEKGEGTLNSLLIYLFALGEAEKFVDDFYADVYSRKEFFSLTRKTKIPHG
jgi:transcriptional regulator with XRE-family HTH domain